MKNLQKLVRDDSGATAIEYGLIAGIVSVGIIAALTTLKGSLNGTFGKISSQLGAAGASN